MGRRHLAAIALVGLSVLGPARPASAHVEPSVTEVGARTTVTVDFTVEHGCDGSPTTEVAFQVPPEVADAAPVDKEGWTSSVDGRVVTYRGGPLAADVEDTFAVRFTAPDAAGTTLAFPFVQTCEDGSIDWIQQGEETERPAPLVAIVESSAPATTAPATTIAGPTATSTPADDAVTTSTAAAAPAATTTTLVGEGTGEATSSGGGVLVVGVLLMTVGAVGFGIWLRRREG